MKEHERLTAALQDQYRVERCLGVGGMATVHLAEDLKHHRRVAIKVLHPELAAAIGSERFLREIEIAATLNHPNILPLFDSGEAAGLLYYVMPQIEGSSLRERLNREPQLRVGEALRIAHELADALDHAHRHGVVHRDMKPENVLLHEGRAILSDFGVALAVSRAATARVTGSGLAMGTPEYMSPEQATGRREIDGRSDLYSLGCVLYEMLAGRAPQQGAFAAFLERPPSLRKERRDVPGDVERLISRCLQKSPDARYASARELIGNLETCQVWLSSRRIPLASLVSRPVLGVPLMILALAIGITATWLWRRESRQRWARTVALPEAAQLIQQGRNYPAFRLLRQVETISPEDPVLHGLLSESTMLVNVRTTPPGALVLVRDLFDDANAWESLGRTPLEDLRVPAATLVWRLSLDGFETKETLRWVRRRTVQFSLQPAADAPGDMVHVPGGRYDLLFTQRSAELGDYWMDRYEVTNREFKGFVDNGGYQRREYWIGPLAATGGAMPWHELTESFKDGTGRPGPATWELGSYPEGQAEYPVSGLSWYEAAAYCAAAGKQLPTVFHWYKAADLGQTTQFASLSNFGGSRPAPVGNPQSIGGNGTYDMAGNVKEWVWNEAGGGRRYILGGGWNEPSHQFHSQDAQPASDRRSTYGFRCARYQIPLAATFGGPVLGPSREYQLEPPVGDDVFAAFRSVYAYDKLPLEGRVHSVDTRAEHWRLERISFAAAYGNERVPATLFLPTTARPPFQTVVYFPGSGAYAARFPFGDAEGQREWFLFLVRTGRAVFVPVYNGSYERYVGPFSQPHVWRDLMVSASKDLQRAIDYLETRPDVDVTKLAYYGLSLGAGVAPIMTALEPRFKASILVGGGVQSIQRPPESQPHNFLPRVTVPTLMINGREDFFYPPEGQSAMFDMLGTAAAHKKHRVFPSGHIPYEWQDVVREMLDWLDRYLGAVPPIAANETGFD